MISSDTIKIYTGYFGKYSKIPSNIEPVSIALYPPKWLPTIKKFNKLSPTATILNNWKKTSNKEEYKRDFNKIVLEKLDAKSVRRMLGVLSKGLDVCLMCYEVPGSPCHRNLVAEWFRANGISCEEIDL